MLASPHYILATLITTCMLIGHNTLYASTKECLKKIELLKNNISTKFLSKGYMHISDCREKYPYLEIILVNLDDSKNKINITHEPEGKNGYPLKTIKEHAQRNNAKIAINGFTWDVKFKNRLSIGYKPGGYAIGPDGTVYVNGNILHTRETDDKEASIGFYERTTNGTTAKFFTGFYGENIEVSDLITLDSSTKSIMRYGEQSDAMDDYYDRVSAIGFGEFNDANVLIMISSSSDEISRAQDHYEVFNTLGADSAIRLDGSTASSLYLEGRHVNPLYDPPLFFEGDARRIMYAITVTRDSGVDMPSLPPIFKNVTVADHVFFSKSTPFSGCIDSEAPLSQIMIEATKPDGSKVLHGTYPINNSSGCFDMSRYSFGADNYVGALGVYSLTITATNSEGQSSKKSFQIEVIPNVSNIELIPSQPVKENSFNVVAYGNKLNSDIRMTIGTDDTKCDVLYKLDNNAEFKCHAYHSGNFRLRLYYKNNDFILHESQQFFAECQYGETETMNCGSISNGEAHKTRACSLEGTWEEYGACVISCNDGYHLSGNQCIANTSPQLCTPDSQEVIACDILNGFGENVRTCASDGMSWGDYEGCTVISCNDGYVISGNSCTEDANASIYDFYLDNEALDVHVVEAGSTVTASVTSYYSGNVANSDMNSVKLGYYLSVDDVFDASDVLLGTDSSSLGSDDTSDDEREELIIPNSTEAGDYYLLFVTDRDNAFTETDESNNINSMQLTVVGPSSDTYDFFIKDEKLSKTSALPGDEIRASMNVYYSGNVLDDDMGGVTTAYYLIATNEQGTIVYKKDLGTDTSHLGSDDIYDSENLTFNVPSVFTAGEYKVVFVTDDDKQFAETNEDNNGALVTLFVGQDSVNPTITKLEPSSPKVQPQGVRTTAYIHGENFKNGASVKMCWYPSPDTQCTTLHISYASGTSYSEVLSSEKIKIHFKPGWTPTSWSIQVTNPDGETSNTHRFNTVN